MSSEAGVQAGSFGRDEGRRVFGTVAAAYAVARPGYPERVYQVLRDRCGLGPSSRVLEVGAGSGQATTRLVESGASIVAVEPDPALVDRLRAQTGTAARLEVVAAAFEDVDLAPSSFDLVAAATSFHWLDPEGSLPKIAAVLKPDGWLALWWNVFGDPDLPDRFHDATEPLLRNLARGPGAGVGRREYGLDAAARIRELREAGFRDVESEAVPWTLALDASQTRQLYSTFSNIARLPAADGAALLDEIQRIATVEFGDRVERQMVTPIYTAQPPPR